MPYKIGNKWKAQVRRDGRRKEKSFNTKKEAIDWEAEMRKMTAEDWLEKTGTVCLGDWAQAYLDFSRVRHSDKTYDEKRSMFRRFFKQVDPAMPVADLNPAEILAYVIKQKEERSGYAANKDRKNLVAAWNWGMKYLNPPLPGPNPCLVEKMPEVRTPRYIPPAEDFWKIYEIAEGQDKVMLLTFLHLAARRGEVFRMTWADVDFGDSRVRLWTRKRHGGTYEFDWLPMTRELRRTLLWWWEHRPIKDQPHVFLCLNEHPGQKENYGNPFVYNQKMMPRLCRMAGVKPFGFHAIRHLTASILYKRGYEVGTIQAILRHKKAGTTERYLRSIGMERVRDVLEDLEPNKAEVVPFNRSLGDRRGGARK